MRQFKLKSSIEGRSITNDTEILIKQVCDRYKLNPQSMVWIEHYLASGNLSRSDTAKADRGALPGDRSESFDKVSLPVVQGFEPRWLSLTKDEVN